MLSKELNYKKATINKRMHASIHEIDLTSKVKKNPNLFKRIQATDSTQGKFKSMFSTPITKNDPLNAFSNQIIDTENKAKNNAKIDVKKKLFGEPFSQSQENLKNLLPREDSAT
jgi:hypothetical protein